MQAELNAADVVDIVPRGDMVEIVKLFSGALRGRGRRYREWVVFVTAATSQRQTDVWRAPLTSTVEAAACAWPDKGGDVMIIMVRLDVYSYFPPHFLTISTYFPLFSTIPCSFIPSDRIVACSPSLAC